MSSQMQAFGSWRIILLNSDDLGDDGDVLTRVGENAAAFRPGGGGGAATWGSITGTLSDQTDLQSALDAKSPAFDQELNTDNDVVFGSVSVGTAPFATVGDIRVDSDFTLVMRNGADDANIQLLSSGGGTPTFGDINNPVGISGSEGSFANGAGEGFYYNSFGTGIISTDARPVDLIVGGDLNINGTPGVTNAAIVVDGVTLSFTKGILTGVV